MTTLVAVAVLPLLFALGWLTFDLYRMRLDEENTANIEMARATAGAFDAYIDRLGAQQSALGRGLMHLTPYAEPQARAFLRAANAETPAVTEMHWVTLQGVVLASSGRHQRGERLDLRQLGDLATTRRGPAVGGLERAPDGDVAFLVVSAARDPDGRFGGLMVAEVDPQVMGDRVLGVERFGDGRVLLLDQNGRLVDRKPRPKPAPSFEGRLAAADNALVAGALAGREAAGRMRSVFDQEDVFAARVPVPEFGWVAGASRPASVVLQPVQATLARAAVIAATALLAAALIAATIGFAVLSAVRRLKEHAMALRRGDLGNRAEASRIAELCELAEQLNESARARQQLTDTLEMRIAERTAVAEHRASQLRALASQLTHAELTERHRLAQLLHDHLQQLLVATRMTLSRLQVDASGPAVAEAFSRAKDLLAQSIAASRSLAVELSPPALHDIRLVAALQWLSRWFGDKHGLLIEVRDDDAVVVRDETKRVLLFEAVRELLFNVVKHAGTGRAELILEQYVGEVAVVVADAGGGMESSPLAAGSSATGLGLFAVQERIALVGGTTEIHSAPGQGTRVRITVPEDTSPQAADVGAARGRLPPAAGSDHAGGTPGD